MNPSIYYRYRPFDVLTLKSLCNDEIFFSQPGKFNDPFDCNPDITLDLDTERLEDLLRELRKTRIEADLLRKFQPSDASEKKKHELAVEKINENVENEISYSRFMASDPQNHNPEDAHKYRIFDLVKYEIRKNYEKGVCCFSANPLSMLLWSHYAEQHAGLCMGYSIDRNPRPNLLKVIYTKERKIAASIIYEAIVRNKKTARFLLEKHILLHKSLDWRYEKEYRLIGQPGLQDSPLLLREIIFGMRCDFPVMHAVMQALAGRKQSVRYFVINEVKGEYGLERRQITPDDLRRYTPRTAMSINEEFDLTD